MIRMIQLSQQGFHCSQILLIMGLEAQGKNNVDLVKSMAGLAGGLGFSGDVCGTLTGGACLLGLYAGKGDPREEEDERLNLMIGELVEWFANEYGRNVRRNTLRDHSGRRSRKPDHSLPLHCPWYLRKG